jgi:hypothetical protein
MRPWSLRILRGRLYLTVAAFLATFARGAEQPAHVAMQSRVAAIEIQALASAATPAPKGSANKPKPPPPGPGVTPPPSSTSSSSNGRELGRGVAVAGIVAAGVGAVFGTLALLSYLDTDRYASTGNSAGYETSRDFTKTQSLIADASYVVGASLFAGGVYLWLSSSDKSSNQPSNQSPAKPLKNPSVSIVVGPGETALVVGGRF